MKYNRESLKWCCWVWRTGRIEFGRRNHQSQIPNGAIFLGYWSRAKIAPACRLAYDNKTLLVPGIPEARTSKQAIKALIKFKNWLVKCDKALQDNAERKYFLFQKNRGRVGIKKFVTKVERQVQPPERRKRKKS